LAASLAFLLISAGACSLLTNLDFVGNGNRPDAGHHSDAGFHPDAATPKPDCDGGCSNGRVCKAGSCSCPTGELECNGECIDSLEDAGYCGHCGTTCRADQSCCDGGCACEAGETDCGTQCADLGSDPEHCGACEKRCSNAQSCIHGTCKSSPCDGFCANPEPLPLAGDGYRKENIGTGEHCYEVENYKPTQTNARIVCWNFDTNRALSVNGKAVPCTPSHGFDLPALDPGWYCVQVGAGGADSAGLVLPNY
jgi:hypothetical protein